MTIKPNQRLVVGFAGRIGSGKTTAAKVFTAHGFTRVRFAGPLKSMMKSLGLSDEQIDGDLKEKPCELLCGNTPRYAMQTIGTEWGRDLIGKRLWINAWRAAVDRLPPDVSVVVDDVRFSNEAKAIRDMGGLVIKIERLAIDVGTPTHASEHIQFECDQTLFNCVPLKDFEAEIELFTLQLRRDWSWACAA